MGADEITSESLALVWHSESRLAVLRFLTDTQLTGKHGKVLVDALTGWIGTTTTPFALLADAKGVHSADADYRTTTGVFFRQHRDAAYVALINLGPLIRFVAEMFRIGTGLQMKAFADEEAARSWLRSKGIAA
jgi:hypothetical protein